MKKSFTCRGLRLWLSSCVHSEGGQDMRGSCKKTQSYCPSFWLSTLYMARVGYKHNILPVFIPVYIYMYVYPYVTQVSQNIICNILIYICMYIYIHRERRLKLKLLDNTIHAFNALFKLFHAAHLNCITAETFCMKLNLNEAQLVLQLGQSWGCSTFLSKSKRWLVQICYKMS